MHAEAAMDVFGAGAIHRGLLSFVPPTRSGLASFLRQTTGFLISLGRVVTQQVALSGLLCRTQAL